MQIGINIIIVWRKERKNNENKVYRVGASKVETFSVTVSDLEYVEEE
jgi:hypothetical protein